MTEVAEGVTADPEVMHGKPVIEGTRVPVEVVLDTLAEGVSIEEVCEEFELDRSEVLTAVRYAADRISDEEYRTLGA
ncbi:MAG: DUF433 domain-containing protein [Candidatus Nanohaloarchaea archaeon]